MAGRGPAPKDPALRQRTNRKSGASVLSIDGVRRKVPVLPNHDLREWHEFTLIEWRRWWTSPMAEKWIDSDFGGLYKLALLNDEFFKHGNLEVMKEIRLQEPRFGLTPLDRSRLQWEIVRGDEAGTKRPKKPATASVVSNDPRAFLRQAK